MVVCCYNGADGLKSTLDSLRRQTIKDRVEVIVVDDGSEPPIEERDVTSRGATLVRHHENRGLSVARNTGLRIARAPIVAFTDDDCLPIPNWADDLGDGFPVGSVLRRVRESIRSILEETSIAVLAGSSSLERTDDVIKEITYYI